MTKLESKLSDRQKYHDLTEFSMVGISLTEEFASIGKNKTFKSFNSFSPNLVSLLILMPRFQILHIPGPETARLIKKC